MVGKTSGVKMREKRLLKSPAQPVLSKVKMIFSQGLLRFKTGFLVIYTVYAICLWMIAFDLVVLYKLITLRDLAYQKAFQIFCWGSPLVPAIVVAGMGKIGYSSGGLL